MSTKRPFLTQLTAVCNAAAQDLSPSYHDQVACRSTSGQHRGESMAELPSGTVTFLFTDIEGSTTRWEHQPEAMGTALARHDVLLRAAIREHDGHVVKTMGDAFHAVFVRAPDAVAAALDAQRGLQAEPWGEIGPIRVRMAVHTGADRPCEQGG